VNSVQFLTVRGQNPDVMTRVKRALQAKGPWTRKPERDLVDDLTLSRDLFLQLMRGKVRRPRKPSGSFAWRFLTRLGMAGGLANLLNEYPPPADEWPDPRSAWAIMGRTAQKSGLIRPAAGSRRDKDLPPPPPPERRARLRGPSPWGPFRYFSELGREMRDMFKRYGWTGVHVWLLWHPVSNRPHLRGIWRLAVTETLLFARAAFDIAWCAYGNHWYIRDDVRRKECLRHRQAAWQARYREKNSRMQTRKRAQAMRQ
jgi:hypothetical protein